MDVLDSADSFEQFVLLSVVELTVAGEAPVHSYDVTQTAKAHLDDIEREPFGGVERQEVIAALRTLADAGLLTKARTESATGKGRPAYELAVEPEEVLTMLEGAESFGPYVETIRAEAAD